MLKISGFEFFVRILPEAFIFIFAAYAFSKTKVNWENYSVASLLLGGSVFIIRMLPINYGVHTILNIIIQTIIVAMICKINMIEAIKCAIITAVMLFISEGINIAVLKLFLGDGISNVFTNPTLKTIAGLPSIIFFAVIIIGYYIYLLKRKKFIYV